MSVVIECDGVHQYARQPFLKYPGFGRAGSTPAPGTNNKVT
jgi:hypothetical protein